MKIFIDLDDVLVDFSIAALAEVGCPVNSWSYRTNLSKWNPEWGFDIILAANTLHPSKNFTREEFWNALPERFWERLTETPEYKLILAHSYNLAGSENVFILTAPTNQPYVAQAKMKWMQANRPVPPEQLIITKRKDACADDTSLLIDDSDKNINAFVKAGGNALLVPRPWNSLHGIDTYGYLANAFRLMEFARRS